MRKFFATVLIVLAASVGVAQADEAVDRALMKRAEKKFEKVCKEAFIKVEDSEQLTRIYGLYKRLDKAQNIRHDVKIHIVKPNRAKWEMAIREQGGELVSENQITAAFRIGLNLAFRQKFLQESSDEVVLHVLAHELGHGWRDFYDLELLESEKADDQEKAAISVRSETAADKAAMFALYEALGTPPASYVGTLRRLQRLTNNMQRIRAAELVLKEIESHFSTVASATAAAAVDQQ